MGVNHAFACSVVFSRIPRYGVGECSVEVMMWERMVDM